MVGENDLRNIEGKKLQKITFLKLVYRHLIYRRAKIWRNEYEN